jgi:hypothetical protein
MRIAALSKATDYILKLLEIFVSKEGSPLQELSFTFQMVSPEAAAKIRERTKALKRYVQSLGSRKMGEGVTPFLYVCLAKQLEPKDLN